VTLAPGDSLSVITWHVRPEGLNIWRDGVLVAVIGHDKFPNMIEDLARGLLSKSRGEYLL
jgi:hypothetical protein